MKSLQIAAVVIAAAAAGAGLTYAVQQPFFAAWIRYAEKPNPADRKADARHTCRELIILTLHEPESAKFPDWQGAMVENPSSNTTIYNVYMPIMAKNAFNATRRATMVCRLEDENGKWRLIDINQLPL